MTSWSWSSDGRVLSRFDRSAEANEYRRLYNRSRWRKLRRDHLDANPFCKFCEAQQRVTLAKVVDHVTPHRGSEDLFFDPLNLQGLCKPHHDASKAQQERGGWSSMSDAKGYPIDPSHPQNKGGV